MINFLNKKKFNLELYYIIPSVRRGKIEPIDVIHLIKNSNDGVQAWLVGIPLIAAATYWRKKTEDSKNTVNNWDSITPENISLIHPTKALLCPLITDYTVLAPLKDIYKYAYEDYKNRAGYMNWALGWRRVYYYLGGTEDLS